MPKGQYTLDDIQKPKGQYTLADIHDSGKSQQSNVTPPGVPPATETPWYEKAWNAVTQNIGSNPMDVSSGMVPHMPNLGGGGQTAAFKRAENNPTPRQQLQGYAQSPPTLKESESPVLTGIKKGLAGTATDINDAAMAGYSPVALAAAPVSEAATLAGKVGKAARLTKTATAVTFGAQGGKEIGEAGISNTPEAWQRRLYGGAMVAGAGAEGYHAGQQEALTPPAPPPGAELPSGSMVQRTARAVIGAGEGPMKKVAKAAIDEHGVKAGEINEQNAQAAEAADTANATANAKALGELQAKQDVIRQQNAAKAAEVAAANQKDAAEHAQAVARIEGQNKAGQEAVAKRAALDQKATDDAMAIAERAKQVRQQVHAEGQQKYAAVDSGIENSTNPAPKGATPQQLAGLVDNAVKNELHGSRENVQQFQNMLRVGDESVSQPQQQVAEYFGTSNPSEAISKVGLDTFNRLLDPSEQVSAGGTQVPLSDIRGFKTELGVRINNLESAPNPTVPKDVINAMKRVYRGLDDIQMKIAEAHGQGAALKDANAFWAKYRQTFDNMRSMSYGQGSPAARLVRVSDPPTARALLATNPARERLVTSLQDFDKYDPGLAAAAQGVADTHAQVKNLPAKYKILSTPEAPTPTAPKLKDVPQFYEAPDAKIPNQKPTPEPPNLAQTVEDARRVEVQKWLTRLRAPYLRVGEVVTSIAGLAAAPFNAHIGGAISATGISGLAITELLAQQLERPKVVEWLTKPTPRDIAILNNIDPRAQVPLRQAITQAMVKNKVPLTPEMKSFLLPTQAAAVAKAGATAAVGTVNQGDNRYPTPQSVMLGMKSGALSMDEGNRLLQKMRGKGSVLRPMEPPK